MRKYTSFKHMCNSDTPSEDAETQVKPLKPVPGLVDI